MALIFQLVLGANQTIMGLPQKIDPLNKSIQ
jgi:hypothetical protein